MNKYILISNSVKDYITLPNKNIQKIILTKNINSVIKKLLQLYKLKNVIYSVIFIHINELKNTGEILTGKFEIK